MLNLDYENLSNSSSYSHELGQLIADLTFLRLLESEISQNRLNPYTPVPQRVADEVVFGVFKVKESSFFKSDLTDPPQIFDVHLLENTN